MKRADPKQQERKKVSTPGRVLYVSAGTVLVAAGLVAVGLPHQRNLQTIREIERMGDRCVKQRARIGDSRVAARRYLDRFARSLGGGRDFFKAFDVITFVELEGTAVGDDGLRRLRTLPHLNGLSLKRTEIGNEGLAHLRDLAKLELLDLSGTQITDAGLAHLEELSELWMLDLTGTRITDAGLKHLRGLTNLKLLSLHGTEVSDAEVAQLRDRLPQATIEFP